MAAGTVHSQRYEIGVKLGGFLTRYELTIERSRLASHLLRAMSLFFTQSPCSK